MINRLFENFMNLFKIRLDLRVAQDSKINVVIRHVTLLIGVIRDLNHALLGQVEIIADRQKVQTTEAEQRAVVLPSLGADVHVQWSIRG